MSPHFSHPIYSVGGSGRVYCVVLGRPPQRTAVSTFAGSSRRTPCIHSHLHRLVTIECEKCGLALGLQVCGQEAMEFFHLRDLTLRSVRAPTSRSQEAPCTSLSFPICRTCSNQLRKSGIGDSSSTGKAGFMTGSVHVKKTGRDRFDGRDGPP